MVLTYWIKRYLLCLFRELVPDIVRIIGDFPKDCMQNSVDNCRVLRRKDGFRAIGGGKSERVLVGDY